MKSDRSSVLSSASEPPRASESPRASALPRSVLQPFVTQLERPVFALRNLPEEVVAVLFAYYSRSREPLRENLLKLLADGELQVEAAEGSSSDVQAEADDAALAHAREKARQFHEKWVVGYGHASVAEHAVVHLALEDVSILASKVIEDSRLASYTEKSTRYVAFEAGRYHRPRAIMSSRHAERYTRTMDGLFETYTALQPVLQERLQRLYPPAPEQKPGPYAAALRSKACDVLRALLPASTYTNLGLTLNGRVAEHMLSRLLSDSLEEVRGLGQAMKEEAQKILPTLIKYAAPNVYRAQTHDALDALADVHFRDIESSVAREVSLMRYDVDAETTVVAAILYPYTRAPMGQLREAVAHFTPSQKEQVLREALSRRGGHDNPLRALEQVSYQFDLLVDFGAYRDIQRHRLCTQHAQAVTVEHGYELPEELELLGLADLFERRMDEAAECYRALVGSLPYEASYCVPLAFRRRLLMTMNLRELVHFVELRSAPQGHRSYRRVAQEIYRQVEAVHPTLAQFIRVNREAVGLERLRSEEKLAARRGE
ncbi:MAG: FAD-dependent thymidylate synthase [Myxococcota bacterium]